MKPTLSCPLSSKASVAVRPPDTSSGTTETHDPSSAKQLSRTVGTSRQSVGGRTARWYMAA
jgi:hypothetical protein